MKIKLVAILSILPFCLLIFTRGHAKVNPEKTLKATRIAQPIKLDGRLEEEVWHKADIAREFVQREPVVGLPCSFPTEVRFLYDEQAIYISASMTDPEPEKILKEFSIRDQLGNADNFSVFIDAYNSGLNGFLFQVSASGVELDAIVSNHTPDFKWNAIWESAVHINGNGWNVEIKIPFSALRFSADKDWNIQFEREIRRFRETSNWSPINPLISGWVQQSGRLTDIEQVKAPVRLALFPYVSGYLNSNYKPDSRQFSSGTAYTAGMDLKYGINDAFTLDMTLVPDFGQIISDRQILNLSPFEVFFEDNRQFFTEGTELFNRGRLFYSRRVGGTPLHFSKAVKELREGEVLLENPNVSQLYNATKISGRTGNGTGIGIFNAVVGEEFAIFEDTQGNKRSFKTNPFTNYNAVVIDQNLANNSYFSVINTNVLRDGKDYDANVTGSFFDFRTKDQKYHFGGSGAVSQRIFSDKSNNGYTYNLTAGKISGLWTFDVGHGTESVQYNPNDFGFLYSPNEQFYYALVERNEYKDESSKIQYWRSGMETNYRTLFQPRAFNDFHTELSTFVLWKTRLGAGGNMLFRPLETRDYFEPRTADFSSYLSIPSNYLIGGFVSTDYRKPFAFDLRLNYTWFDSPGRHQLNYTIAPRIRFSDKFSLFANTMISHIASEPGYVNKAFADPGKLPVLNMEDILFGVRNRQIVDNSITSRWIFNKNAGINLRVRHYWARVLYQQFGILEKKGDVSLIAFDGNNSKGDPTYNQNVNIFNIDMQLNWRFAPGSDLIFVWKNQIFSSDAYYQRSYTENFWGLTQSPQDNSLSLRILYYLDYLYLFPAKSNAGNS